MAQLAQPTLRERQQLATRKEIVDAALELFEERRFRGTTIEDIAHRVGMSSRTVFRHFPTKNDLILGWMPAIESFLNDLPLTAESPHEVLRQLEDGIEDGIEQHARLITSEAAASFARFRRLINSDPDLRTAMSTWEERFLTLARTRLTAQLGEDRGGLDIPLVIQLAAAPAGAALDAWAHSMDGDLLSLYRAARRRRHEILAG